MNTLPAWATALSAASTASSLGFVPIDEAARDAVIAAWLAVWDQVPYDDTFHAACRARIARAVPFMRGPSRYRTLSREPEELLAFFDPERPDEAFVSLSAAMPAPLAPCVGTNPESFAQALAVYLRDGQPGVLEQPKVVRIAAQVQGELKEVEASFERIELWLDDVRWGSACDDDPWRGIDAGSALAISQVRRTATAQNKLRFPSLSVRTLWSKSILRVERHAFGEDVFELRYTPTPDPTTLRRFRAEHIPIPIPEDVPVDVVASLLRSRLGQTDVILAGFEAGTAALQLVPVFAALYDGEAEFSRTLQRWVEQNRGDQHALFQASRVFRVYESAGLVWEVFCRLAPGPNREELRQWLQFDLKEEA